MKCPVCEEGTLVSSDEPDAGSRFERFVCDNCNVKITVEQPDDREELIEDVMYDILANFDSYRDWIINEIRLIVEEWDEASLKDFLGIEEE